MEIKELDVLKMKNGKTATVLEVCVPGRVYLVEFSDEAGKTEEIREAKIEEIEQVIWSA